MVGHETEACNAQRHDARSRLSYHGKWVTIAPMMTPIPNTTNTSLRQALSFSLEMLLASLRNPLQLSIISLLPLMMSSEHIRTDRSASMTIFSALVAALIADARIEST